MDRPFNAKAIPVAEVDQECIAKEELPHMLRPLHDNRSGSVIH